jgi:formylglycine-generating enzyme required for sulfatase activity
VTLGTGAGSFAWDNERPTQRRRVAPFDIDAFEVTNADYMAFVEAGGYRDPQWWRPEDFAWVTAEDIRHPSFWHHADGQWQWRGMFEFVPLPASWPVYATWAEANAYAKWRGMRLPTEAEFHRAAYGTPTATSAGIRGAMPSAPVRLRTSTFSGGILIPWTRIPTGRARLASTISSATDGNGRRASLPRSKDSNRCLRTRNTRRSFSTAIIS